MASEKLTSLNQLIKLYRVDMQDETTGLEESKVGANQLDYEHKITKLHAQLSVPLASITAQK